MDDKSQDTAARRTLSRRNFIVGAAALAGSPWLPAFAAAKPNLRLGVLSDVHIAGPKGPSPDAYRKALLKFRDAHVDGVCITGDLAIWGQIKEFEFGAQIWFDVFPDDKLPDGSHVERLFCTGNHDDDGWAYQGAYKSYRELTLAEAKKSSFFFHRQETWKRLYREDWAPIFVKRVKGYLFVMQNWMGRAQWTKLSGGQVPNEKIGVGDWFAAHDADVPRDRPFFYLQHEAVKGTCNDPTNEGADRGEAKAALSRYPNAIALTGHTHYSLAEERSIWQGEFTSVNCGSTCGWAFTQSGRENGHGNKNGMEEMPLLADAHACRQGMLMDVFDDRIVLKRFEVLSDRPTGPDWVIPLGTAAKRPYLFDARAAASRPPVFPTDAKVTVRRLADGQNRKKERHPQIEVSFPPVNGLSTAGDRAFDYQVDLVKRDGGALASSRVFSPKILGPAEDDAMDVTCLFAESVLSEGVKEYAAVVTPINEWGKRGEPIRSASVVRS